MKRRFKWIVFLLVFAFVANNVSADTWHFLMNKNHSSVPLLNVSRVDENERIVRIPVGMTMSIHSDSLRTDGSITMIDLAKRKVVAFAHRIEMKEETEGLKAYASLPVDFFARTPTGIGQLIFKDILKDDASIFIGEVVHNDEHFVLVSLDSQTDVFKEWIEVPVDVTPRVGLAQIIVSTPSNRQRKVNVFILAPDNEGLFLFHLVDSDFTNRYGGILHGMSGSPIIQDGKLIGAVSAGVPLFHSLGIMTPIDKMPK